MTAPTDGTANGTWDLITTTDPNQGAADSIDGGTENDIILGGTAGDTISGADGNDLDLRRPRQGRVDGPLQRRRSGSSSSSCR